MSLTLPLASQPDETMKRDREYVVARLGCGPSQAWRHRLALAGSPFRGDLKKVSVPLFHTLQSGVIDGPADRLSYGGMQARER